ncbi:MAG: hypothetical protein NT160_07090 [Actinobacteria bacterium]|nr:hypothetical protein [Actinomycetota bacterium]
MGKLGPPESRSGTLSRDLSPLERSAVPGFDEVADVIIVGFGAAGTCAARTSLAGRADKIGAIS